MKSNVKRLKDCKVQMSVEVEAEQAEERYQEVLRGFQRAARLPGFRDGKAPVDLIEQRYQSEAREELLKMLIPEAYHQSIQTQKAAPVSLPKISDIRYERKKKLQFSAEFEEAPKISLKNYKGVSLKRTTAEVTTDELEKSVQSLLESRATFEEVTESRAVQQGDFIVADIELWRDTAYIPGRKGVLLVAEKNAEDDFFEKILGVNTGEVREIVRAGKPYTRLTVRGLRKKLVPVLDGEFAKGLGQESAETLREAIRKELAQHKQTESMEKMKQELFQKLLKANTFPLPDSLVERQKERLLEQSHRHFTQRGLGEQDWKAELPAIEADMNERAKEQVKLYFILQKVTEEEGIELDEIELAQRLKALSEQSGRPLEEVRKVFEDDVRDNLREKKTVEYLIANAKFEE